MICQEALSLHAEHGLRASEGHTWDSLGYAEQHLGNAGAATACFERALAIFRELGERFYEADTLANLADTRNGGGDLAGAREAWQQALKILEDIKHPRASEIRGKLAGP